MTYKIIATGSTGNALLLEGGILIDCGVPFKALEPYVKSLRLVCLTHIHGDHFNEATIRRLARERPGLRFACCEWLVWPLLKAGVKQRQIDELIPDFYSLYNGFAVAPVLLHHNVQNCGFRIVSDDCKIFYATDTGDLDGIEAKGYDLYFVEANHTMAEIEAAVAEADAAGEYTYRLRAAENHLSREQAVDWLCNNMNHTTSRWIPMHGHVEKKRKEQNEHERNETDSGDPAGGVPTL